MRLFTRLGTGLALAFGLAAAVAAHDFGLGSTVFDGRLRPGEVDRYSLWLRSGEILTASVVEKGRGEFNDPVLEVFAPDAAGAPTAGSDDDAGPGFLPSLSLRVDGFGWWTVAVSGFADGDPDRTGHAPDFAYRLVVGVANEPPRLVEREGRGGNGDLRSADPIPLLQGAALVAGRLTRGDVDVFQVWLAPGAKLDASVFDLARGEFHDSVLRLRDRDGNLLAEDDDGGPGFLSSLAFQAPDAGVRRFPWPQPYYLELTGFDPVADDGRPHPEVFDYELTVAIDQRR